MVTLLETILKGGMPDAVSNPSIKRWNIYKVADI